MGERLKQYLLKTEALVKEYEEKAKDSSVQEGEGFGSCLQREKEKLLIQIGFFQHERLIHLIVTVLFALMTILVFMLGITNFTLGVGILLLLLLTLLIPYIKHYYLLENGTQMLYRYYDRLEALYDGKN